MVNKRRASVFFFFCAARSSPKTPLSLPPLARLWVGKLARTTEEVPLPEDVARATNRFRADRYIEIRHPGATADSAGDSESPWGNWRLCRQHSHF